MDHLLKIYKNIYSIFNSQNEFQILMNSGNNYEKLFVFSLFINCVMNWSSKMRLIGCLLLVNVMISTSSRWDGILPWYSGSSKYLDNVIIHIKTNNTLSKLFFIILFIIILIYHYLLLHIYKQFIIV